MTDLERKFDELTVSTTAKLEQLNSECRILSGTRSQPVSQPNQAGSPPATIDTQFNIVVFGVEEDRDDSVWRRKVGDILQFFVCRLVDVTDVPFRAL